MKVKGGDAKCERRRGGRELIGKYALSSKIIRQNPAKIQAMIEKP